jgi:hypothetical protein
MNFGDALTWINRNAGLLSLLFSFLVTGSTLVYAYLTHKLVQETIRMRRAQTDPEIVAYLELKRSEIDLVIKNTGGGGAYDVAFSTKQNEQDESILQGLENLGIFKGMKYMAPGQEFRFLYSILTMGAEPNESIWMKITYRGPGDGTEKTGEFTLSTVGYERLKYERDTPLINIAKSLEELARKTK